ncbi:hypothetical protein HYH03_003067 [Edaphochlamys debaryana]|uniref:Uncharacterized protein n=1 Tax=Edaphochlamys debaryana TaxID=47281 RepID=A0A835YHQ4_9CHLO|nr:hypothetical protein HYH03_003067 [Edaphochlamys debaryana]|eukprot:KAG2498875.1 hypothetical protein HYH03_003067 [Edaphochlamys debaryana]
MAPQRVLGPLQQQQSSTTGAKKRDGGLLSKLFGSLRSSSGRNATSAPAPRSVQAQAGPGAYDWPPAQSWQSPTPSVATSALGAATAAPLAAPVAPCPGECHVGPWMGYPTDLEEKYELTKELGRGGNGVVRIAVDRDTGTEYACKSIKKTLGGDFSDKKKQGHLDSIRREVQVLTKLKGSLNIVKLEDVYEDEEHVHVIMELCKGGELWHRIGDAHYSERTVASFMRAVLRTLAQCHAQHILHRDIKPGNFMLLSDDERAPLKAIDFGLAAPFEPDQLPRTDLGLEGTPWYMAPETLRGEWLPASDIWSAGVMAFQLLCGRFPFDDKKNVYAPAITAIWRSVLNDPLDFDKPWWAGVSQEAKDFCAYLLNRNPAERPTAKEALKHPWLRGNSSERSTGKKLGQSVVARIQRFAAGSQLKRTVLQSIAAELLTHPELLKIDRDRTAINENGRPIVAAPDSACLGPMVKQLRLDRSDTVVDEKALGEALASMGFKLTETEVKRLMEEVDLDRSGGMDLADFAATQMDWRYVQQSHRDLWLELASKAFRDMDTDGNGMLEVDELLAALKARLPPDEVHTALELALQDAGAAGACGGIEGSRGIDFEGFMSLLKVGSLDSLDLYDDRMSVRSGGSGHSMDRAASLLRAADWSRHGPNGSRHNGPGLYGDVSGTSRVSDVAAMPDNDRSVHAPPSPGVAFRFDLDRSASGKAGGSLHGVAGGGAAAGSGATGGMVWRFDVGERVAPPPPPPPCPFRFDVSGPNSHKADQQRAGDKHDVAADASSNRGAATTSAVGATAITNLGREGGYYDRRHHGSQLYRNVALKHNACALQSANSSRLDPVAE